MKVESVVECVADRPLEVHNLKVLSPSTLRLLLLTTTDGKEWMLSLSLM